MLAFCSCDSINCCLQNFQELFKVLRVSQAKHRQRHARGWDRCFGSVQLSEVPAQIVLIAGPILYDSRVGSSRQAQLPPSLLYLLQFPDNISSVPVLGYNCHLERPSQLS